MADAKKLLARLEEARSSARPARSNRTIALREPEARNFFAYCRARGFHVQDVLDVLIAQFLDEVGHPEVAPVSTSNKPSD